MGAGMMLKANSVANKAGGYEREEQERKKYHGKGPRSRMNRSARQKAEEYNDHGVKNPNNYNLINSPGEKYRRNH